MKFCISSHPPMPQKVIAALDNCPPEVISKKILTMSKFIGRIIRAKALADSSLRPEKRFGTSFRMTCLYYFQ